MYKVKKRNGKVVDFEIEKISAAMKKAFDASDTKYDDNVVDFLALKVTADFQNKININERRSRYRCNTALPESQPP